MIGSTRWAVGNLHMTTFRTARLALTGAATALALILAGCQEPVAPAPPPVAVAPAPPPPITLSSQVTELAAAYQGYMSRASAVSPLFSNGDQIQDDVRLGAAYEPKQLMAGAVAYAAVVALQDPAFVAGVRTYVDDPAQRRALAAQLVQDPAYAVGIKGSDTAAGLVIDSLYGQGLKLYSTGKSVKFAAYDVQRQNWSKLQVADQPGRLARAKLLSTQPIQGSTDDATRLQMASTGAASLDLKPRSAHAPYSPMVIRGLAIAALAALGEGGDRNMDNIRLMLTDGSTDYCLNMSKLNLYQCLAVAKPHYEDVFCLGQHILMDTGQCLIKGVGGPTPIEIYPRDLDLKAARLAAAKAGAKAPAKKPVAKAAAKKS
jgi:hypothetical protein